MKNPKQARREAKALFRSCQVNGVLDAARVRQVVQQVIALKPRGYLAILNYFQRMIKLDEARRTARVESATALAREMQTRIEQELTRQYGPGLMFSYVPNPALIGGIRVRVGSDVYDGTVQGRLNELRETLSA